MLGWRAGLQIRRSLEFVKLECVGLYNLCSRGSSVHKVRAMAIPLLSTASTVSFDPSQRPSLYVVTCIALYTTVEFVAFHRHALGNCPECFHQLSRVIDSLNWAANGRHHQADMLTKEVR
jgi:hypothetical protein